MTQKNKFSSSRADRPLSFKSADFPLPQGNEEEWRFTPLERISEFFDSDIVGVPPQVTIHAQQAEQIVEEDLPRNDARLGKLMPPEDKLGALAWESFSTARAITVKENAVLDNEVVVGIKGQANGDNSALPAALQLLITAEKFSQSTIVLNHIGSAKLTSGVEVMVEEGAQLVLVSIQDWDSDAKQALSYRVRVGRNATFRHIVVTLGGDIVRITTSVEYADTGGDVDLLGAYFVDTSQHFEHHLFIDHNQPDCRSHATYKGALQGESAHSVWIGDVLIRPQATGTDTYELNRNLILTQGAAADSVPNLEIETGEIAGAGHASATGRFDDEQLFYLKSRGIPEAEARRLVVRGFFAELINKIGVPSVEAKLLAAIEEELALTMGVSNG